MATWTDWELVDNIIEAADGNVAWDNNTLESPGGEADVLPGVGQVSNRLILKGAATMWPELSNDHRLRRVAIQFDMADKTSTDANLLKTYWSFGEGFKSVGPTAWPSYIGQAYDETASWWGFPFDNDGQLAMRWLLLDIRYLKFRVDHAGADTARFFIKNLSMRVQYDDPLPAPPDNRAGILLGM